jgi:hypothetical protein
VTHFIVPDGAYARAYRKLTAVGHQLTWQSQVADTVERQKKQASKRSTPARTAESTPGRSRALN